MEEIARALVETRSVMIRPEAPFRLTSGRDSPVYVDCRRLISFPRERARVTAAFAELARREVGLEAVDVIGGGETAGIPFAAFLAAELDWPMIYVRKSPKRHGGGRRIEGVLRPGERVLLVEDLVTDGKSKIAFKEAVEREGGSVQHVLCVFEYFSARAGLTEGRSKLRDAGMDLHALTHWDEVLDALSARGELTADEHEEVLRFLREPGNYSVGA